MKKVIVIMLAVMLSIFCLVGCTATKTQQEEVSNIKTEQKESSEDKIEQKEDTVSNSESKESSEDKTEKEEETVSETEQKESSEDKIEQKEETVSKTEQKDSTVGKTEQKENAVNNDKTSQVNENKIKDGTYHIDVTFSGGSGKATVLSPAKITINGDSMVATIEWNSSNYDYMIVNGEKYLSINAEGNSVFQIPVVKLDKEINVIGNTVAMSKPREIEYTLTFHSSSIKDINEEATSSTTEQKESTTNDEKVVQSNESKVIDGTYYIDVKFGGGSGKATVLSPAKITIKGDSMVATIEWNSSNYDYMIVNGEKYLAINTEGNSVFEIPVLELDVEINVIGNTVAMSKPREIEYTLTFLSGSIRNLE